MIVYTYTIMIVYTYNDNFTHSVGFINKWNKETDMVLELFKRFFSTCSWKRSNDTIWHRREDFAFRDPEIYKEYSSLEELITEHFEEFL